MNFRRSIYQDLFRCPVRVRVSAGIGSRQFHRRSLTLMADEQIRRPAADEQSKKRPPGPKPDMATFAGLLLAIGGILGGLLLEGGKIEDISQMTAAMIVLGGTLGAVMVTTPLHGPAQRREAAQNSLF